MFVKGVCGYKVFKAGFTSLAPRGTSDFFLLSASRPRAQCRPCVPANCESCLLLTCDIPTSPVPRGTPQRPCQSSCLQLCAQCRPFTCLLIASSGGFLLVTPLLLILAVSSETASVVCLAAASRATRARYW